MGGCTSTMIGPQRSCKARMRLLRDGTHLRYILLKHLVFNRIDQLWGKLLTPPTTRKDHNHSRGDRCPMPFVVLFWWWNASDICFSYFVWPKSCCLPPPLKIKSRNDKLLNNLMFFISNFNIKGGRQPDQGPLCVDIRRVYSKPQMDKRHGMAISPRV